MDIDAAFRILQERQAQGPNSLADRPEVPDASVFNGQVIEFSLVEENREPEIALDDLYEEALQPIPSVDMTGLSELALLNMIMQLQSLRIQSYACYNKALHKLISMERLDQYQFTCANMTQRFNAINVEFRKLMAEFTAREHVAWAKFVENLQNYEREKLTLAAALHLDECREHWLSKHGDNRSMEALLIGKNSTIHKIQAIEEKIRELMEEIQLEKQELLESLESS